MHKQYEPRPVKVGVDSNQRSSINQEAFCAETTNLE